MAKSLSVRRQADRERMAQGITELALSCGATVNRRDDHTSCMFGAIRLDLTTARQLQVSVEFDRAVWSPDVYVLSWHMHYKAEDTLNPDTFGGDVNPHHFAKATYVARGYEDLCTQLKHGLIMAADGTAFRVIAEAVA